MRKNLTTVVLSFAGLLFVFSPIAFADYGEDNDSVLKGKVRVFTTVKTKEVLGRVKVKLYDDKGRKVDSDKTGASSGRYKFEDLEEGKYRLKITLAKVPGDGVYRHPKLWKADRKKFSTYVKVKGSETKKNIYLRRL